MTGTTPMASRRPDALPARRTRGRRSKRRIEDRWNRRGRRCGCPNVCHGTAAVPECNSGCHPHRPRRATGRSPAKTRYRHPRRGSAVCRWRRPESPAPGGGGPNWVRCHRRRMRCPSCLSDGRNARSRGMRAQARRWGSWYRRWKSACLGARGCRCSASGRQGGRSSR